MPENRSSEKPNDIPVKPPPIEPESWLPSRRSFVAQALTAASAIGLARLSVDGAIQKDATVCGATCTTPPAPGTNCGNPLEAVGEIKSENNVLEGLLIVVAENRSIPSVTTTALPVTTDCRIVPLRSYVGYQGFAENPSMLRTKPPISTPAGLVRVAQPGPTFRAHLGDLIQILFLNRIDEKKFFGTHTMDACDVTDVYPPKDANGQPIDKMPNCFHGGNTTNLHFHGTHVTPSKFGDNVLIQVTPDLHAKPDWCRAELDFMRKNPGKTAEIDPHFQKWKAQASKRLSPQHGDLVAANTKIEAAGEWPEYWEGAYPYSFVIPKYVTDGNWVMGQAPGTHWYHAHKHGAASLQLLNGMSGAFVIEGDYDRELRETLPGIQEKVLVFQQFDSVPIMERGNGAGVGPALQVNGQLQPTIKMRPGEIQWWRIVNATIEANQINTFGFLEYSVQVNATQAAITAAGGSRPARFTLPPVGQRGTVATFRTIARDGVQFDWLNYNRHKADTEFRLAQGNRVDILVQAPTLTDGKPIDMVLSYAGLGQSRRATAQNSVLRVRVEDASGPPVPMAWPPQWEPSPADPNKPVGTYLTFPEFLHDIDDSEIQGPPRSVAFGAVGQAGLNPIFQIDGKQFQDGVINQCMVLGKAEEWKISNTAGGIMHPFHIHVNPFQILEINDGTSPPQTLPKPWVWQDVIEIPVGGYVRMRSRFVDFTGKYVLHCHILGHEDRGMMQLVEVRPGSCPATPYSTVVTHGH
jgi:FtsP/CotA-like multicopper oxidase with cupredoxin domain